MKGILKAQHISESSYLHIFKSHNHLILILTALMTVLDSCHQNNPQQYPVAQSVPVNVAEVERQSLTYYDMYPANVVALKEVELRCEVGGDVTGIFFNDGQKVKNGQKLYEIDRSRYEAAYNQANANYDIAQSNLERAQRDADRYIKLNQDEAIAKQRLDYAMTDLQNAKSQVVAAKAAMAKAETDLKYSVILAPFDGTIGISQVRLGALVVPDQTLLNVVSTDDPMGVDFVVNQKELNRFELLEKRKIGANDSIFRILMPNSALYPEDGKITIIDRAVDPQTGTIKVRLSFPNHERMLRAGMSCNVEVLNENSGLQLVIPYKAVLEQMSEYFVFKLDSLKAKQTRISLGTRVGPNVIVHQGLDEGDEIVVEGVQRLHNGVLVALNTGKSMTGSPENNMGK